MDAVICDDCRHQRGTYDLHRLCCAARMAAGRHIRGIREHQAQQLSKTFGHDVDAMRQMAAELRRVWRSGEGTKR